MNRAKRTAFTLVEMLVVISIIGVLASLLLPAVQAARESARRAVCVGNQQSLAKACTTYEGKTTEGRLPGYHNLLSASVAGDVKQIVSWPITLFPYLDQENIYLQWRDGGVPTPPPAGLRVMPTPEVAFLMCPSDVGVNDPALYGAGPALSYVINAGMAGLQSERSANGVAHNYFDGANFGPATNNNDFRDGRGNTLLFSENVQATHWSQQHAPIDATNPNRLVLFQNKVNGNYKETTVFVWHQDEFAPGRRINADKKTAVLSADTARPSSYHPGGVVATFADSHVTFIRQTIDYRVYKHLMTPNGKLSDYLPVADKEAIIPPSEYE